MTTNSGFAIGADAATFGVSFVYRAVAIVVFSITTFGCGACFGNTLEAATAALTSSCRTNAGFASAATCTTTGVVFVGATVTIVVFAITALRGGFDFAGAGTPVATGASLSSISTDTFFAGRGGTCVAGPFCAIGTNTAAIATASVITGDPTRFSCVGNFVPGSVTKNALACGCFADDGETFVVGDRTHDAVGSARTTADIEIGGSEAAGQNMIASGGIGRRSAAPLTGGRGVLEIASTIHPVTIQERIS